MLKYIAMASAAVLSSLLAVATPSLAAAPPQLSGTYLISLTTFCSVVGSIAPGDYVFDTGTATFNLKTGTFSISLAGFNASVASSHSKAGDVKATSEKASNQTYSNTTTQIKFGDQVSQVVYGNVKNGVAQQLSFYSTGTQNSTPKPTSPNCISSGTASHL